MKTPDEETKRKLRSLWRPKRQEMPEQCASCPFRDDNDLEWFGVVRKLAKAGGLHEVDPSVARLNVRAEVEMLGDFICHCSAYNIEDMSLRDPREYRQCPGASSFFKEGRRRY
jgi:hypothetical protein